MKAQLSENTNYYKANPTDGVIKQRLKEIGLDIPFEAYSVGNDQGQIAIFPCDDFGKEQARENAKLFVEAYNRE